MVVLINFLVMAVAEIAIPVNWKCVSTCLWPCCVYLRKERSWLFELCYLSLMVCLMQSMPFHGSAAALAVQHKHVNVDLSPRCPTESNTLFVFFLFVEKCNTDFSFELILLGCFFIKCCKCFSWTFWKGVCLRCTLCSIKCPFFILFYFFIFHSS